mmetsp:Transcript_17006/g.53092  ORF Transcript_17006/g.53092 Transcript_17006/m.53092 type:complete len:346 (+) Transcript_17006:303-1340(+)
MAAGVDEEGGVDGASTKVAKHAEGGLAGVDGVEEDAGVARGAEEEVEFGLGADGVAGADAGFEAEEVASGREVAGAEVGVDGVELVVEDVGRVVDAEADELGLDGAEVEAEREAGGGAPAAAGEVYPVEGIAAALELRLELGDHFEVAPGAEGGGAAAREGVGSAALGAQLVGESERERPAADGLELVAGRQANLGADHARDEEVPDEAGVLVGGLAALHEEGLQADPASRDRRRPAVIRLNPADRDHAVAALRLRRGEQELELPHLVPRELAPRVVVPLDRHPAPGRVLEGPGLDRGREVPEPEPRRWRGQPLGDPPRRTVRLPPHHLSPRRERQRRHERRRAA